MKKSCFVLSVFLFIHGALGTDGIEWLNDHGWGEVISVSSTNLLLQLKVDFLGVSQGNLEYKYWEIFNPYVPKSTSRRSSEYIENNELLVINPDGETRLTERHARLVFTPVSFLNQHKGFQIMQIFIRGGPITNAVIYLALSDTPMEVGEEDVEMIWKEGEFRTLEEFHAMVQHDREEEDKHNKFLVRFFKALDDRSETEEERRALKKKLMMMGSKEAILAYLDELDRQDELERQQDEPLMPNTEDKTPSVTDVTLPPNQTTRRAWLWWLALPVVAGAWFVFQLKKRRKTS